MIDLDAMTPRQFALLAAAAGRFVGALRDGGKLLELASAAQEAGGVPDDEANAIGLAVVAEAIPDLMENHSAEVYGLVAALNGQTLAEYEAEFTPKGFVEDVKGLFALLKDGELASFLA